MEFRFLHDVRARFSRSLSLVVLSAMFASFSAGLFADDASPRGTGPDSNAHWLKTFSRDILATDRPVVASRPTWTKTSSGDTLLATISGDVILLRRFAADGTTLSTYAESLEVSTNNIDLLRLVEVPGQNAFYMLAGNESTGCLIRKYGTNWNTEWSHVVPSGPTGISGCRDLSVLADGSVLTLNQSALSRFDTSGQILWTVQNGDDNWYFNGHDLLVDDNGVIWVASSGGLIGSSNVAAMLRFGEDGTRLAADTFLCSSCVASSVRSLDLMPDGKVLASGTSGGGQPGFFARYSASGARELLVESESGIGYERVTHDGNGAIYVLATINSEPVQIRRLAGTNGSALWSVDGSEMVADDAGIVVTRETDTSIDAVAFNAFGGTRWTRTLVGRPGGWVSRARAAVPAIEWLGYGDVAATASCGTAPRLIALDANGSDAGVRQPCLMPSATSIRSIDAQQDVGVLVNLGYRLATFSEDGALKWEAIRCPLCTYGVGYTAWGQATLTGDGGAWAVEGRQESDISNPSWSTAIQRIDIDGAVLSSTPFSPAGFEAYDSVALIGTADEVIALQARLDVGTSQGYILWQRSRRDGSVIEAREIAIPMPFFELTATRRLPDGGISVVATSIVWCSEICDPQDVILLRFAADSTELWRHALPTVSDPFPYHVVTLNADGSATAVIYDGDPDGRLQKREIDANGNLGVDVILTGIPANTRPTALAVGAPGEFLLRTRDFDSRDLLRLDADGDVLGSVPVNEFGAETLASSAFGELLRNDAPDSADAVLFDRSSLTATAAFDFGAGYLRGDFLRPWRALDNGSVYGATTATTQPGLRQAVLARFTVPGSAAESIFGDGFD